MSMAASPLLVLSIGANIAAVEVAAMAVTRYILWAGRQSHGRVAVRYHAFRTKQIARMIRILLEATVTPAMRAVHLRKSLMGCLASNASAFTINA